MQSIAQRQAEHPPISVHVVPLDIDDERALALLDRYVEAVEAGEHTVLVHRPGLRPDLPDWGGPPRRIGEGAMIGRGLISPAEVERAWRLAFHTSLDDHSDGEISWEARYWRDHGAPSIAEICDALLAERRMAQQAIPGGADAGRPRRLLARVDAAPVLRLVRDEGLCLLAAMRLAFWVGLREVPR